MLPMQAVGWQASAVRRKEAGHFCKAAGMSIVVVGGPRSASRQPSGLKKFSPICLLSLSLCTVQGAVPW